MMHQMTCFILTSVPKKGWSSPINSWKAKMWEYYYLDKKADCYIFYRSLQTVYNIYKEMKVLLNLSTQEKNCTLTPIKRYAMWISRWLFQCKIMKLLSLSATTFGYIFFILVKDFSNSLLNLYCIICSFTGNLCIYCCIVCISTGNQSTTICTIIIWPNIRSSHLNIQRSLVQTTKCFKKHGCVCVSAWCNDITVLVCTAMYHFSTESRIQHIVKWQVSGKAQLVQKGAPKMEVCMEVMES